MWQRQHSTQTTASPRNPNQSKSSLCLPRFPAERGDLCIRHRHLKSYGISTLALFSSAGMEFPCNIPPHGSPQMLLARQNQAQSLTLVLSRSPESPAPEMGWSMAKDLGLGRWEEDPNLHGEPCVTNIKESKYSPVASSVADGAAKLCLRCAVPCGLLPLQWGVCMAVPLGNGIHACVKVACCWWAGWLVMSRRCATRESTIAPQEWHTNLSSKSPPQVPYKSVPQEYHTRVSR